MIFAIVLSVSICVNIKPCTSSSFSNVVGEDRNFLNGINIPKGRWYLKPRVIVNGFELTTDLSITDDQKADGLSVKDHLKENEGNAICFWTILNAEISDERYEISNWYYLVR